jgi:hypothetical protein
MRVHFGRRRMPQHPTQVKEIHLGVGAFIIEHLWGRVEVRRPLVGSDYVLNPNQFVGVVALPSGRRLECYPKVPVRSLF